MPEGSESIFSSSKSQEDVRHDLDAVQKCWTQEKVRRLKRALLIIVPIVALPVIAYAIVTHFYPNLQLSRISDPPLPESAYDAAEGRVQPPPESPDIPSKGNPDAKLCISVIPQMAPENLLKILYAVVEAKPSEIYLKMVQEKSMSPEDMMRLKSTESCGLALNGKTTYTMVFPDGKKKVIDLMSPFELGYTPEDLCVAITQLHEQLYGKPRVPVFPKIQKITQKVISTIPAEDESQKRQNFDFLQTPQETPDKDK